jgi:hypothetical protein
MSEPLGHDDYDPTITYRKRRTMMNASTCDKSRRSTHIAAVGEPAEIDEDMIDPFVFSGTSSPLFAARFSRHFLRIIQM